MNLDMTGGRKFDSVESPSRSAREKRTPNKSSQGQTGPKISLDWDGLAKNEKRVLRVMLPGPGEHRKPMTISEIAVATGWSKRMSQSKANSWVRNQMRRLVRSELVEHAERIKDGRYVITDAGKRLTRAHVEQKQEPESAQPERQPPATF